MALGTKGSTRNQRNTAGAVELRLRFIGVFPAADFEIPDSVTAFLVDQLGLKKAPRPQWLF